MGIRNHTTTKSTTAVDERGTAIHYRGLCEGLDRCLTARVDANEEDAEFGPETLVQIGVSLGLALPAFGVDPDAEVVAFWRAVWEASIEFFGERDIEVVVLSEPNPEGDGCVVEILD